jgi:hypothetical protein
MHDATQEMTMRDTESRRTSGPPVWVEGIGASGWLALAALWGTAALLVGNF